MGSVVRFVATSDSYLAAAIRVVYRRLNRVSLPAPVVIVRPLSWLFIGTRAIFHFLKRIIICEPLFKARCRRHGKRLRTGVYVHWIEGPGEIVVGDDVTLDGKIDILFGRGLAETPTLVIGDHTFVGHNCTLAVAKGLSIGSHCLIANNVWITDSPGHPVSASQRLAGLPPDSSRVRPVTIGNNVWIGRDAVVLPGVTIGDNSVVAACAVVTKDVPPNKIAMGNPARVVSFVPR